MKLSISNIAWDSQHDCDVYAYIQKAGFQGLEIAPSKLFGAKPYEELAKAYGFASEIRNKYNLCISSMQSIWYGKSESMYTDEGYAVLLQYTEQAILFAEAIDCPNLVFGCPRNRNLFKPEDEIKAIEFFKAVGDFAIKHGTVFALEANPTIYNTNFMNYTDSAVDMVKAVNSPGVKLNYDLGTVIQNQENIGVALDNIDLINHIHISEPYLELIQKRSQHKELLEALNSAEYNKFVSIEMKQQELSNVYMVVDYFGGLV